MSEPLTEPKVDGFPTCPDCGHNWHGMVCNVLDETSLRQGQIRRCPCEPCYEVQR